MERLSLKDIAICLKLLKTYPKIYTAIDINLYLIRDVSGIWALNFHTWVFLKIYIIAYRSLRIRTSKERSLKLFCSDSAALTLAVKSNGL